MMTDVLELTFGVAALGLLGLIGLICLAVDVYLSSRRRWNMRYARRISERSGWTMEEALRCAEVADDAYQDRDIYTPEEAADEEMSCWSE